MSSKYFPSYSINLSKETPINFHEFVANLREELNECFIDFDYVNFIPQEGKDGRVYIAPVLDLPVTIGGEEYSVEEVLSPTFLTDYSDGSELFKEDYEETVSQIKREMKEAAPILRDFASSWGFRKDRDNKVTEALGKRDEKVTLHYDSLYLDFNYGPMDMSVGLPRDDWSGYISYDYEVDKADVADVLGDYVAENIEKYVVDGTTEEEMNTITDEEINRYVDNNFDQLFDEYYEELTSYYKEDATEKAIQEKAEELNNSSFDYDDEY